MRALSGPIGGAHLLREQGTDRQTAATWLQAAGYRTGLFGKYVNGYGYGASEQTSGPGGTYYVPPGWTRWRAMASPEHFGGVNGVTYTLVDEHGLRTVYGDHDTDAEYSTDVLAAQVRTFIADAVDDGRPFFAVWTPYASHNETATLLPEPAKRHFGIFADLPLWRPASWAEADVSDKLQIVQTIGINPFAIGLTDRMRQGAYESLLAVDEQLRVIQDQLVERGIAQNTVIILTSDNGVCWGEHRLFTQAKDCLYEESLRVPLIIYDPRASGAAALQAAPALNVDIAPTVAAFAGVEPPVAVDGVSLTPWVTGPPPAQWRGDFPAALARRARRYPHLHGPGGRRGSGAALLRRLARAAATVGALRVRRQRQRQLGRPPRRHRPRRGCVVRQPRRRRTRSSPVHLDRDRAEPQPVEIHRRLARQLRRLHRRRAQSSRRDAARLGRRRRLRRARRQQRVQLHPARDR